MVFSHYISYGMHRARHCRQNAIWTSFGVSWPSIRTPNDASSLSSKRQPPSWLQVTYSGRSMRRSKLGTLSEIHSTMAMWTERSFSYEQHKDTQEHVSTFRCSHGNCHSTMKIFQPSVCMALRVTSTASSHMVSSQVESLLREKHQFARETWSILRSAGRAALVAYHSWQPCTDIVVS